MPSGDMVWGLDAEQNVFGAFGITYQPVTILVTRDGLVKAQWPGLAPEAEIRAQLDELIAANG